MRVKKLIFKTILYRLTALVISFTIFYVYFGEVMAATKWMLVIEITHTVWYICYERLWKKYKKKIFK